VQVLPPQHDMKDIFSIRESLRFGWHTVRTQSALVFQVVLILLGLQVLESIIQKVLQDTPLGFVAGVALSVLIFFVSVGATIVTLRLARGESAHLKELLPPWRVVGRSLLASALSMGIMLAPLALAGVVCAGLVFMFVGHLNFQSTAQFFALFSPTLGSSVFGMALAVIMALGLSGMFYLAARLAVVRFTVLEGPGVVKSVREGWSLTRGSTGKVFLFLTALIAINVLGMLALFVGLLVTLPVSLIAYAYIYEKLKTR